MSLKCGRHQILTNRLAAVLSSAGIFFFRSTWNVSVLLNCTKWYCVIPSGELENVLDHTNHSNNTFNAYCMCEELRRSSDYAITRTMQFCAHGRVQAIVQKSVSYHKQENYVVSTKSALMRMIVMELWYFHSHTGIWPEPIRHQNLYISYGDSFMKQAKLCTMSLNLNTQKSLESRNQYLNLVYHTKYWEFFYSKQYYHASNLTRGPKIPIFKEGSIGFSQKTEHYQLLSLFSLFLVLVHMHFPNSAFI